MNGCKLIAPASAPGCANGIPRLTAGSGTLTLKALTLRQGSMARAQLLQLLIGQARASGFEFKRWYHEHSGMPWTGADEAIRWLARGKRAHMLVFSHPFAQAFFRSGERITFIVPQQTFQSA